MPAAYLTTPCDVIKARLQVEGGEGVVSLPTRRRWHLEYFGYWSVYKIQTHKKKTWT
ncbi:hypothetical protein GGR56DRAFT_618883 [Xylariaceae sp. FL0804]|nr:hypothetical protein GGR56DRAFT_618883 [Xylariaceae sp. FL0804]